MRRLITWLLETYCYLRSIGCTKREIESRIAEQKKRLLILRKACEIASGDFERRPAGNGHPTVCNLQQVRSWRQERDEEANHFETLLGDLEIDL